jgi:hypothetical protein
MWVLCAYIMHWKKAVIYYKAQSTKHKHSIVLSLLQTLTCNT